MPAPWDPIGDWELSVFSHNWAVSYTDNSYSACPNSRRMPLIASSCVLSASQVSISFPCVPADTVRFPCLYLMTRLRIVYVTSRTTACICSNWEHVNGGWQYMRSHLTWLNPYIHLCLTKKRIVAEVEVNTHMPQICCPKVRVHKLCKYGRLIHAYPCK